MDEWFGAPLHGRFLAPYRILSQQNAPIDILPPWQASAFAAAPGALWLWEAGLLPASMCGQDGESLFTTSLLLSKWQ